MQSDKYQALSLILGILVIGAIIIRAMKENIGELSDFCIVFGVIAIIILGINAYMEFTEA